jgi:hypothetical protein
VPFPLQRQDLIKVAAVGHARQAVSRRLGFQRLVGLMKPLFGTLPLRDVVVRDDYEYFRVHHESRNSDDEPSMLDWRMARVFKLEVRASPAADVANSARGEHRLLGAFSVGCFANFELIDAWSAVILLKTITGGKGVPCRSDCYDASVGSEDGNMREKRVESSLEEVGNSLRMRFVLTT